MNCQPTPLVCSWVASTMRACLISAKPAWHLLPCWPEFPRCGAAIEETDPRSGRGASRRLSEGAAGEAAEATRGALNASSPASRPGGAAAPMELLGEGAAERSPTTLRLEIPR